MSIGLSTKSHYGRTLLITLSFLSMLLVASISHAYANTVSINDQSGVLNSSKVRADAAHLSVSVLIYTTKTFMGDQTALNDDARNHLSGTNTVDIAIDTVQRHLSIQSGSQVKLSDGQASNAVDAFKNSFHNGDYTGATIAAVDSLHDALTSGSSSGGMTPVGVVVGVLLAIAFFVCLIFFLVSVARNRRRGGPPMGGGRRRSNQQWNNGNNTYHPSPVYIPPPTTHTGGGFGGGGFGGGAGGSF